MLAICASFAAHSDWGNGMARHLVGVFVASGLVALATLQADAAGVVVNAHDVPLGNWSDLKFPATAEPFGKATGSRMFKPAGSGPFPGLVVMPTCGGHRPWFHAFDWAKQALDRGFAVLVVDPLTPRGVAGPGGNCGFPPKVSLSRYRKDAVDAAEHLRKQPFVDPKRMGLIGFSFGAMASLGLSGDAFADPRFGAIVAVYPQCYLSNRPSAVTGKLVDVRWVPHRVTVPLQVQMGDLDTETRASDCVPLLQQQKKNGAPVDFVVHKGATHVWDAAALGAGAFTRVTSWGVRVEYRYNPKVTAESVKLAFDFLDRHVRAK
jgi:dienelactone hydrolase